MVSKSNLLVKFKILAIKNNTIKLLAGEIFGVRRIDEPIVCDKYVNIWNCYALTSL